MIHAIGVILRAELLVAKNRFLRSKLIVKIGFVVGVVSAIALALAIEASVASVVRFAQNGTLERLLTAARSRQAGLPVIDVAGILRTVPSVVMLTTLTALLLTSVSAMLVRLYMSRGIERLVIAPVPMRAVFLTTMALALLPSYLLMLVMLAPALVGYGQGMAYGAAYYVTVLLVLLVLPLLPAAAATLLVMGLIRVVAPKRARDALSLIGGLVGVSVYVVTNLLRGPRSAADGAQALATLSRLDIPFLPSTWVGRALVASGEQQWLPALLYGALYAIPALALFGLAVYLAERHYYEGWERISTARGGARPAGRGTRRFERGATWLGAVFSAPAVAIFVKDLRVFARSPQYLQQLFTTLIFGGGWIFFRSIRGAPDDGDLPIQQFGAVGTVGVAILMGYFLASRIGAGAISREGRNLWLLRLAPVSGLQILLGKTLLTMLPFLAISLPFLVGLSFYQGVALSRVVLNALLALTVGIGASALLVGLGAAFPRLSWLSPEQQISGRAGCLGLVLVALYGMVAAGLPFVLPLAAGTPGLMQVLEVVGWSLSLALTAVVTSGALWYGAHRLEQIEDA